MTMIVLPSSFKLVLTDLLFVLFSSSLGWMSSDLVFLFFLREHRDTQVLFSPTF